VSERGSIKSDNQLFEAAGKKGDGLGRREKLLREKGITKKRRRLFRRREKRRRNRYRS